MKSRETPKIKEIWMIDLFNCKIDKYSVKDIIKKIYFGEITPEVEDVIFHKSNRTFYLILNALFGEAEVQDCQHYGVMNNKGHPDYYLPKQKIYIEFKSQLDGLRASQIDWIFSNPDKKTFIMQII